MIDSYNPQKAPNPKEWLALEEQKRHELISAYHLSEDENMPNLPLHVAAHEIVENQIAMGDELPVKKTLQRLMAEGLDRHNAIHAIGGVLMEYMFSVKKDGPQGNHTTDEYYENLENLTAQSYIDEFG